MGKHRTGQQSRLALQPTDKGRNLLGHESQTVHPGVELDMDGEVGDALFLGSLDQRIEQMEAVDFRFQLVVKQGLERRHLGIHDDDGRRNARLTQVRPFICHGNGQIVHPVVLQGLGYLIGPCTVGGRLHHAHHLRVGHQEAAVVVQVVHHGVQVDFENGLMHLQFQLFRHFIEVELARTFYQDGFVTQGRKHVGCQQGGSVGEEILLHRETCLSSRDVGTYPDDFLDAAVLYQLRHLAIEEGRTLSRLQDIGKDQRTLAPLRVGTSCHEVECYVERSQV